LLLPKWQLGAEARPAARTGPPGNTISDFSESIQGAARGAEACRAKSLGKRGQYSRTHAPLNAVGSAGGSAGGGGPCLLSAWPAGRRVAGGQASWRCLTPDLSPDSGSAGGTPMAAAGWLRAGDATTVTPQAREDGPCWSRPAQITVSIVNMYPTKLKINDFFGFPLNHQQVSTCRGPPRPITSRPYAFKLGCMRFKKINKLSCMQIAKS
jgi:hypothetical protein